MSFFRILSKKEVEEFRRNARLKFNPAKDQINPTWHPVHIAECLQMIMEAYDYPGTVTLTHHGNDKKLVRKHLEKFDPKKKSKADRTRYVAWAVFSYVGPDNEEYRKSFEAPVETPEQDFWKIAPKVIYQ